MENPLDQDKNIIARDPAQFKILNLTLIILSGLLIIILPLKIWQNAKMIDNPILPSYTKIFINGELINLTCFAIVGLMLSLIFRIFKKYTISSICLGIFLVVGFLLKNYLKLYESFYFLDEYL